jgi:outer membrane protein OmpA-like peptidoglycan-associated protein
MVRRRVVAALSLSLSFAASFAHAQTSGGTPFEQNIDMQRFRPAPGPNNFLTVAGSRVDGNGALSLGAWANYAWRPFTIFNASCPNAENDAGCRLGDVRSRPVEHIVTLDLMATVTLARRFQLGLSLPLTYQNGQAINAMNGYPISASERQTSFSLGDPRLDVKVRLTSPGMEGVGVALGVFATVPTGRFTGGDGRFVADQSLTLGGRGILDLRKGRFSAAFNVGALWRPQTLTVLSTRVGSELQWGAALGVDITPRVTALVEFFGASALTSVQQTNTAEGNLAVRYHTGDLAITAGGGTGLLRGAGVPVLRAFLGVMWAPLRTDSDGDGVFDQNDRCPAEVEDRDNFDDNDGCPEDDNDGDGMADGSDRCPDQAEDRDNFQDQDGCPDLDNDGDGVNDGYDSCPREAEDRDGDHDEDGCPDNDRDRDGVRDDQDRCPDDPEDVDGFADADGCPEPDNDRDGVLDVNDQCSDQPETMNGIDDTDGCPDQAADRDRDGITDDRDRCPEEPETFNNDRDNDGCPESGGALAAVSGDQIRIVEPVNFELNSDRISGAGSFRVLDSITALLNFHPEIRNVEIQGHTDDRGDAGENRALSLRRAAAVKRYLVEHGISAERLTTVGVGPDHPIADNNSSSGRARNRRVEFHVSAPGVVRAAGSSTPTTRQ